MVRKRRYKIYLAGPISGCNPEQLSHWRFHVKDRWSKEFDFIDPSEDQVHAADSPSEVVRRDEAGIESCDAVLANMWRESIGTAIGVAHARYHGKPVMVVDSNRLNSRTLAYFANAVTQTLDGGMRALRALLRTEERFKTVTKRSGEQAEFSRQTLVDSIRSACREADRNDLLATAEILPRVMEELAGSPRIIAGSLPTSVIRDAVWSVLAEFEADSLRHDDFSGIREVWERHDVSRRAIPDELKRSKPPVVHSKPLRVAVRSGKSHASIWGKTVKSLKDIPRPASRFFGALCRVEGIAEIRLTRMSTGPKATGVRGEILASKSPGIIEGRCYDNGPKGQIQQFQIRVHDPDRTEAIRLEVVRHLASAGLLFSRAS